MAYPCFASAKGCQQPQDTPPSLRSHPQDSIIAPPEAAIELLIAELDARDGDPDLEPEEDRCVTYDDDPKVQFDDEWPGDADDAEEAVPNWHVSAAHSRVTPLFVRPVGEASHG